MPLSTNQINSSFGHVLMLQTTASRFTVHARYEERAEQPIAVPLMKLFSRVQVVLSDASMLLLPRLEDP